MKKENYKKHAQSTINLQILALQKLKKSIGNAFNQAVKLIGECTSKTILVGVGKSGHVASQIAASLSSVGAPSFALSASDCSHGDLGSISKKDILILISNSGETAELKPITSYANRNRIALIGITTKKNSFLYKAADIKLLIPEVKESGPGSIVPSSSIIAQASLGSSLVISVMKYKKHGIMLFKKWHPAGSISKKLLTVKDLMIAGKNKIPFVNENLKMQDALKILRHKNLGFIIVRNSKKITTGILTDGDLKRKIKKNQKLHNLLVKKVMTPRPISISQDMLATKALSIMQDKKITALCVNSNKSKYKTTGVLHIHNILRANI